MKPSKMLAWIWIGILVIPVYYFVIFTVIEEVLFTPLFLLWSFTVWAMDRTERKD